MHANLRWVELLRSSPLAAREGRTGVGAGLCAVRDRAPAPSGHAFRFALWQSGASGRVMCQRPYRALKNDIESADRDPDPRNVRRSGNLVTHISRGRPRHRLSQPARRSRRVSEGSNRGRDRALHLACVRSSRRSYGFAGSCALRFAWLAGGRALCRQHGVVLKQECWRRHGILRSVSRLGFAKQCSARHEWRETGTPASSPPVITGGFGPCARTGRGLGKSGRATGIGAVRA